MPTPGYCRICASPLKNEINRRLRREESANAIIAWAAGKDFKLSRPTIYSHRDHITDPKTTLVEEARKNPAIKRASTTEFLEALVNIGFTRASTDPDSVSLDHALKASAKLEGRRDKGRDALEVIALIVTQRSPIEVIDGEWKEIPQLGNPEAAGVLPESRPQD